MIAGPIPIVENMDKKLMITVAIATTPKSFGANKRANTIETIRLTKNTEYFSIALHARPFIIAFFISDIKNIFTTKSSLF